MASGVLIGATPQKVGAVVKVVRPVSVLHTRMSRSVPQFMTGLQCILAALQRQGFVANNHSIDQLMIKRIVCLYVTIMLSFEITQHRLLYILLFKKKLYLILFL